MFLAENVVMNSVRSSSISVKHIRPSEVVSETLAKFKILDQFELEWVVFHVFSHKKVAFYDGLNLGSQIKISCSESIGIVGSQCDFEFVVHIEPIRVVIH